MTSRVYLYFVLTAILGAVLGGVGVYYYLWHSGRLQHPGGFNPDHAVANLKKRLDLTEAQSHQIRQIFEDTSQKLKDLQKQMDPQFQAVRQETRSHIRQVLNPNQAKKFDEYVRGIDERRRLRGLTDDSPPPPPPPPQQ